MGPDAAPALRPRAAPQRRLLAAHRLPGPAGLRVGLPRRCGWPTARCGRSRSPSTSPTRSPPAWRRAARLALRDPEGVLLAALTVDDLWTIDREAEAQAVFGTTDRTHPGVAHLFDRSQPRLRRRPARGPRAAPPLRLRPAPPDAGRAARPVRAPRLAQGRRLPDPQPAAPRPRRADPARRPRAGGQPADPPGGRDDQARRRRPLHPGALLPGDPVALPGAHRDAVAAAAGDAHGRAARGGAARHHPQEPRLHPLHRRPRPRRPGQGLARASPSTAPTTPRSCSRRTRTSWACEMVPFRNMVYAEDLDVYMPDDEVPEGQRVLSLSGTELRDRLAAGPRAAGLVHLSGGGRGADAAAIRRGTGRASPSSSPACRGPASRPSPTCCWSSCWRWAAGR